tara:strand:+ start:32 stop:151 length:120 start_codon:yes stop_codon:yes gene_type:complete
VTTVCPLDLSDFINGIVLDICPSPQSKGATNIVLGFFSI